jgi:hypothetical protein
MGVPSSPATKTLEESLNVVGKIVKTSKYKFADWNIKLPTGTTKLPDAEFKKLSRAAQFFREGYYTTEDIKKIQDTAKEAKTKVKEAEKLAKESKNLWDKFLSKAKGVTQAAKAVEAGGTVAKSGAALAKFAPILTAIAAIGVSVAVNIIQGWRSDINETGQEKLSASISKILGLMNGQNQRIKLANEGVKKAELENQRVRDRVYGVEKQLPGIRESIADAKKKSNDALYEIRTGKVKLEAGIADAKKKSNDALYETRAGKVKLEADIADAKKKSNDALYETRAGKVKLEAGIAEANKKSNDALYETRAGRTKLEDKIASVQSQINKYTQGVTGNFQAQITVAIGTIQNRLSTTETKIANIEKAKPSLQDKVIETIQASVKKVSTDLGAAVTQLSKIQSDVKTIEVEHPKRWGITVTQAEVRQATITKSTDSATRTYVDRKLATLTQSQFSATEWVGRYGVKTADLVDNGVNRLYKNDEVLSGGIQAVATNVDQRIAKLEQEGLQVSDPAVGLLIRSVNNLRTDLEQVKVNEKKIGDDIDVLNTKIEEQEKMNKDAIPKLDQLLGLVPLIPARAANAIRPDIPTISQIETASATGTCRTLQPGGCGAKALNDLGSGVNQNTNDQSNNLLDKLNAGANAAQLALLKIMDNKLGNQITGGISGKLVDGFKWLQLDRALGLLTFAATVQNHLMLSNNIGQTLIGAFTNVLTLVGLKDEKGEAFDVGSVINSTVENLVKGIVGADNYANISEAWAKANRIYQATTNVLNAFQNISSTILSGIELVAGQTGKIGNALRKSGEVLETAYGWMNPQPKINRVTQTLENLQQGASTIQQVTQAPLDVINAVTELQTANTEFVKALKEDDKPANKGVETPEPDALKTKETLGKTLSAGKPLADIDKEADEDAPT